MCGGGAAEEWSGICGGGGGHWVAAGQIQWDVVERVE